MRLHLVLAIAMSVAAAVAPPPPDSSHEFSGGAAGNSIVLNAATASGVIAASEADDPALRLDEYTRADLCGTEAGLAMNADCSGYDPTTPLPTCEGLAPVPPVWHRHRDTPTDPWQRWSLALGWSCPQDALPTFTVTDFRRLPLTPPVLTTQPSGDVVFVNMPTIVFTDPTTQTFTTTLLGYPVDVEATPTQFTWNFGDASDPIVTTSPGHPYPHHDVAYPYPRAGTYTITLTTDFTGRYRLAGTTTWLPVVGTATTTTTTAPITAEEHHTHLVADDCTTNPNGPWCNT